MGWNGVICTVGICAVMSYAASRRSHETGILLALGTRGRDARRMVVRQTALVALAGLAAGAPAAVWLTRFLEGLPFGVGPADPLTSTGVAAPLLRTPITRDP